MLPAILSGLGTAAASPLGQQVIGGAIGMAAPYVAGGIRDWWNGPQQPGPEQQLQQHYMQNIQQPINVPYQQQQQEMMNMYQNQLIPQLANRFTALGAGGQQSNLFRQAQNAQAGDLTTMLEALRERSQLQQSGLEQGRLGQIGGYLGGQQQLGMQAQQLNQQGTIAAREAALRAQGLMQNYNQGQQDLGQRQQQGLAELELRRLMGGLGQQYDTIRQPGTSSYGAQLGQETKDAIKMAIDAYKVSQGIPTSS